MTENNPAQTAADNVVHEAVVVQSRLKTLIDKHPRARKVATITGGVFAALGVVQTVRIVQSNRTHTALAADHAKAALTELSTSVSPQDPEA